MCTNFGERLKNLREKNAMSQDELAKVIGIARSAISRYETQNRQPSFGLLVNIAKVFNVSTDYLLGMDLTESNNPDDKYLEHLLSIYHSLDEFSKGALLERAKVLLEACQKSDQL